MMALRAATLFAFLAIASYVANAADPGPLLDFCVAPDSMSSGVFVGGQFCKNPDEVVVDDFIYHGFDVAGPVTEIGSYANLVDVKKFKGLNTLGLTVARVDFGPHGLNPPHIHPRGSEVFTVLEGTLYSGFVTSNIHGVGNKLYTKTLHKGDSFVFPQGLIHFQLNNGSTPAVGYAVFNSQSPGRTDISDAVFQSDPTISVEVLSKSFQIKHIVKHLHSSFSI